MFYIYIYKQDHFKYKIRKNRIKTRLSDPQVSKFVFNISDLKKQKQIRRIEYLLIWELRAWSSEYWVFILLYILFYIWNIIMRCCTGFRKDPID